ncbi:hypothetical protein [Zongyangia hominis]|uniref:Major tropism determinant N-terminal domain-containing protein n=1 Tax=Zongyangia hominis TaxID=2763677 RepID=A0A926IBX6_9FIRM|nr:hypothetical protein [Zongyangia hominis]MBC8570525.1 hypothetical protein [Zongyangia hominis]
MASTNHTEHLGLNQWILTDKPRMDDFNSDNLKIDQSLGTHVADGDIHVTAAERAKWNGAPRIASGTYVGDNSVSRTISVGFTPKFCIIFAQDEMPVDPVNDNSIGEVFCAMAANGTGSYGLRIATGGFTITHQQATPIDRRFLRLNLSGTTYGYFAIA